MSLENSNRKALVVYTVNYYTENGYSGFYESTELLSCNLQGKVNESILHSWEDILKKYETAKLNERTYSHGQENEGKVVNLNIVIKGFTKLD